MPETTERELTLAQAIREALAEEMRRDPTVYILGEDVAEAGTPFKVLSGLATSDLIAAIRGGQVDQLVRIPGVGKKTAERIVLELRDKLEGVGPTVAPVLAAKPAARLSTLEQDVLSALLNLGCKASAAEAAVWQAKNAGVPEDFEPLFRKALELVR